jgi:hypothetical protein
VKEPRLLSRYSDGLTAGQQGWIVCNSKTFYPTPQPLDWLGRTHSPPAQWVEATVYPGVKWPEREADHSRPYNAEVNSSGAIRPLPHMSTWRVG